MFWMCAISAHARAHVHTCAHRQIERSGDIVAYKAVLIL